MIDTVYKYKDPNKLNAWLKNVWNNYFMNYGELTHDINGGRTYRIIYHRFYWFWQDKWSLEKTIQYFHSYHYEINECFPKGGSCTIDWGTKDCWFPKNNMWEILRNSATYWNNISQRSKNENN